MRYAVIYYVPSLFGANDQQDSLLPAQVTTSKKLMRSADCYQQVGVKYPHLGVFHSYAELLHFALAEGDPTVTTIVPQPLRLRIGKGDYVPDCYLVRSGIKQVVEIKPRGEFDAALRQPVEAFLAFHGMQFVVIANEAILEREIEALNWLHVVRTLSTASALSTLHEEQAVWNAVRHSPSLSVGQLLDFDDPTIRFSKEIALYRLLHRGLIQAEWTQRRLHRDTEIRVCA